MTHRYYYKQSEYLKDRMERLEPRRNDPKAKAVYENTKAELKQLVTDYRNETIRDLPDIPAE